MTGLKYPAMVLIALGLNSFSNAQGLSVYNSANMVFDGPVQMVLYNGTVATSGGFNNDGFVVQTATSNSTVFFQFPNSSSFIGGNNASSFKNIYVATNSQLLLNANISVDGDLTMGNGLIELNKNNIELGSGSGQIVGETNTNRITGITGGNIFKEMILNAPSNVNPGNIGLVLNTTSNLGYTKITRGHVQQFNASGQGLAVYRYFDMAPTNISPGINADITFYYFPAELVAGPGTGTGLLIWKNPDITKLNWFLVGADLQDEINNYVFKASLSTINYRVSLAKIGPSALPITLLNFSTKRQGPDVQVSWNVTDNETTRYFELEHSADGIHFNHLANIPNQVKLKTYSYTDYDPYHPQSWYRLKIFDRADKMTESKMLSVLFEKDGQIVSLYPNPFTSSTGITIYSPGRQSVKIYLYNAVGQLLEKRTEEMQAGNNNYKIDLSVYTKGIYILNVDAGKLNTFKLIKE